MDKETREFLDRKFNSIDGKIEENKRYFGVVAEGHQILLDGQARIVDRLGLVEKSWAQ